MRFELDYMPVEQKAPQGVQEGRWRHWYASIADILIADPKTTASEIARQLGRAANTITAIKNSDLFQEYYARRRAEWERMHDQAIAQKLTGVAEASLDAILTKINTQGDKIPMKDLAPLATSVLDRLGYAPKSEPAVQVNVNTDNRMVMAPISPLALEEARNALRAAEQNRIGRGRFAALPPAGAEVEAEPHEVEASTPVDAPS